LLRRGLRRKAEGWGIFHLSLQMTRGREYNIASQGLKAEGLSLKLQGKETILGEL